MLKSLYNSGIYPFIYLTFSYDKNKNAQDWLKNHYNIYWVPTVYWDGGAIVRIGGTSQYGADITTCMSRPVADLDAELHVGWLGNGKLRITLSVKNNETVDYDGYVRVYVAEKLSSLGWKDAGGNTYTMPFLDFAVNEAVQIPAGGVYEKDLIWDGNQHNDGYGNNFGGITYDNVMVTAAVFNGRGHTMYSNPPSGAPFTAYDADEVAFTEPAFLSADADTVPEAGGTVNFHLCGYGDHAGRNYLLLGSVSGTDPGTPLPGGQAVLPLNWDTFTNVVLSLLNSSIFSGFMGTLDGTGYAAASLNLPPVPGMAGITLYFAYALNGPWNFASNPVSVEIVP